MTHEYDPDDNFGHAFGQDADIDEEAAREALLWQLLLLINPDDEDTALQQFATCREVLADGDDDLGDAVRDAIDWKSGFFVGDDDPRAAVESLDELVSRFNLRIAWDDDGDDDFPDNAEVPSLIQFAYDVLREHHYTLWTWETGSDHHAGWITRQRDEEALRLVAGALGFHVRAGAG